MKKNSFKASAMGGCRCTYRNCSVKSDGKTHMFHYPVFEKIRCHQWLVNAHKLEFLDLKVSQLKNRVVCQHHFKDENFMNFKKDKLTFDAIPTEDGPYCDTNNYVDLKPASSKLFSIIIDDIDNDYNDKKANYSLKYGDYLANLDLMDIEKIDDDSISSKNTYSINNISTSHKERDKDRLFSDDNSFAFNISLSDKSDKKSLAHPTHAVSQYNGGNDFTINDIQNYLISKSNDENISIHPKNNILVNNAAENVKSYQQQREPQKREPKVKIISEKKITNPVPITGKFEPVSPNFVLNVSNIKRKAALENIHSSSSKTIEDAQTCNQNTNKIIEIEIEPLNKGDSQLHQNISSINLLENSYVSDKTNKFSILKPKVPPERVEAINKKREFNMKLRDMVETCLDKLDNCNKPNDRSLLRKNIKPKVIKKKVPRLQSLPKNAPILSPQEYTIAFLEARMRKMENTLLEKIEQNSIQIIDLKNSFAKGEAERRLAAKMRDDEEIRKKELFQDISQYLSPSTKSIIYEELFINKFSVNDPTTAPKHKRRRRK